jgi:Domain of unknown function (DUF4956)
VQHHLVFSQIGGALPAGLAWDDLALRLGIDLGTLVVLVRVIHFRYYRRSDLFLTFFALNLIVFLVTLLLNRVEMTMGAAFGLFAVFSMLRYRTEGLTARDMTYLFLVIGLGLLMAVAPGGWPVLVAVCALMLVGTIGLEAGALAPRERAHPVMYDNIALVHAGSRSALLEDLRARTGLNVRHVDVEEIDFVRDTARLTIHYRDP